MTTAARRISALAAIVLGGVFAVVPAHAEDTKGKWQVGFGISYFATTDYIRSNSDIAIATSTAGQQAGVPSVASVDDRPDENMLNEPSVADDFRLDFNVSYGLTRWLALEVAGGYLTSSVGNIEYFINDSIPAYGSASQATASGTDDTVCGPEGIDRCFRYDVNDPGASRSNLFVPVGEITELPIMLSALVRFRPESPLDPYVGLGFGYIFTDLELGGEFVSRSEDVTNLRVTAASEGEFTSSNVSTKTAAKPGFQPAPMTAEVSDGFEYHVVGGVDYYLSDKMSMYVDARYMWSDTSVDINIDGYHQVRLGATDLGKLQSFTVGSIESPSLWEDQGFAGCPTPDCDTDGLIATEDSNGNGTLDTGPAFNEGNGTLYFFPAGPNPTPGSQGFWTDPAKAIKVVECPACANNGVFDTEDVNNNRIMDRYLQWAVDVCSQPDASTNPMCKPTDILAAVQYIWPDGCNLNMPVYPSVVAEGCPRPPGFEITNSGVDDLSDIHLIQGGEIKLGGFSIGVGMKFTF
jgi:opacity protein-like surface antigen